MTQTTPTSTAKKRRTGQRAEPEKPAFSPKRGRPDAEQAAAITATILSAASDLVLSQGYEATTMDAIAKRAGVPKSTLYKRYADKKSLLQDVIHARLKAWATSSVQQEDALPSEIVARLKFRLKRVLFWTTTDEVRAFSRLGFGVGEGAKIVSEVLNSVGFTSIIEQLENDIRQLGTPEGQPAQDPKFVATAIMSLLAGWVASRPADQQVPQDETERFVERAIELVIQGSAGW